MYTSNISNHSPITFVFSFALGAVIMMSLFNFAICQDSSSITDDFLRTCTYVPPKTNNSITAYVDWPFKLSCEDLVESSGVPLFSPTSQCFVSSGNLSLQLSNNSITISPISQQFLVYTLSQVINGSQCYSTNVSVELQTLPTRSCADDVKYSVERNVSSVIYKQFKFGENIRLDCIPAPSNGSEAIDPPAVPSSRYKTTWYRSMRNKDYSLKPNATCVNFTAKVADTTLADQTKNPGHPDSLERYGANYYDAAIFSCSVTYNSQSAFIIHYSLCIENKIDNHLPTVLCPEVEHFVEGDTVEIKCSVLASNAKIEKNQMEVAWSKEDGDNSYQCRSIYGSPEQSGSSRISCDVTGFNNFGTKCFWYNPDDSESSNYQDKNNFDIRYYLSNVKKSDAGKYTVRLWYRNKGEWSEPSTVTLTFNPVEELRYIITILASVLAAMLTVVLVVGLVWRNWIQINLFYRRHFTKPIEDDRKFVAVLTYFVSSDLSEDTKEQTRKITACIRTRMEKMGYKFFDQHRDTEVGGTINESFLKYLQTSHRMIIVLTDAYVRDRQSRFNALQGYQSMMRGELKLILVQAPGALDALKKSRKEENSEKLMEVVKASRKICWKTKMKEERFMDAIEYALPNLKLRTLPNDSMVGENAV